MWDRVTGGNFHSLKAMMLYSPDDRQTLPTWFDKETVKESTSSRVDNRVQLHQVQPNQATKTSIDWKQDYVYHTEQR